MDSRGFWFPSGLTLSRSLPGRTHILALSPQAALVAQQTLHEVASEDLAMRAAATHSLNHGFLAAAAVEVQSEVEPKSKGLRSLVRTLLLPQVQRALHHPEGHVRSQHLELMRLMAAALPGSFPEMQPLLDEDVEVDFFYNVTHLQMHRRVRALKKLHACIRSGQLGRGVLLSFFVPLLEAIVLESKDRAATIDERNVDTAANMADAAVVALAAAGSVLSWSPYYALLTRHLRLLTTRPELLKTELRVICGVLDEYHFFQSAAGGDQPMAEAAEMEVAAEAAGAGAEVMRAEEEEEEEEEEQDEEDDGGDEEERVVPANIVAVLRTRVVPQLRKHLVGEDEKVRTGVALAVVKVLKLLPREMVRLELPAITGALCALLKSPMNGVREGARVALVDVAAELGAGYAALRTLCRDCE
jgi:U3 small nucleolar RNA-associated protein 20